MKRNLIVTLVLLLALSAMLAGCNGSNPAQTTQPPAATTAQPEVTPEATPVQTPEATEEPAGLSGDTKDILSALIENAKLDFELFDEQVNAENCQSYTGLTAEQMSQYVEDAYASMATMNVSPHIVVLVKCVDEASAAAVEDLIAKGFDSSRWVCVMPDQSFVVDSGVYVLLVSSKIEAATAVKDAFLEMAGDNVGEVNEFFTFTAQ
jgi:hypothetical protein